MEIPAAPARLLTRLFLRRFFDNDLISPDTDRHESLALVCGGLASLSLFISVLMCVKYLLGPPLPGPTALFAVSDRFFFIAASMTVVALATLLVWDALSLEPRDEGVLGPLPVPRPTVVRAKFQALIAFLSVFALAMNIAPTVVYPALLVSKVRVGVTGLLWLAVVHGVMVLLAAVFAFFVVLAVRGLLQSLVPNGWFARVSALVQAVLLVGIVTVLLLLPTLTAGVQRNWLAPVDSRAMAVPPLWFLGAYETLTGNVIANAPRPRLTDRGQLFDDRATAAYRASQPLFRRLAPLSVMTPVASAALAIALYFWNSRRPRTLVASPSRGRALRRAVVSAIAALVARHPIKKAAFFMTLHTLARSAPHRLTMSAALACGVTVGILVLQSSGLEALTRVSAPSARLLAVQLFLILLLLLAFRHVVRIPAELRARWAIELGLANDAEAYLRGAMRAAMAALICGPALVLLPLYIAAFGAATALLHFVLVVAIGTLILEALFVNARTMPFACSYVTRVHPGVVAPVVIGVALVTAGVSRLEQYALGSPNRVAVMLIIIAVCVAALRAARRHRRRMARSFKGAELIFDDIPESTIQRLGLSEATR